MTTVTGTGPTEMKALAAKLKAAPAEMKLNLRRQLRAQAAPAARAARESILSMPSKHDGTLRGEVARTVSASVGLSARGARLDIVSSGRKMPPGKQELPADLDRAKGWQHPVFGRAEAEIMAHMAAGFSKTKGARGHGRGWTWRHQTGKPGWFEVPLTKRAPELRAAAERAIEDVKRKLA